VLRHNGIVDFQRYAMSAGGQWLTGNSSNEDMRMGRSVSRHVRGWVLPTGGGWCQGEWM